MEQLGKHFEAKLLRIKQTLVLRNGCPEDSEHGLKLLASLSSSLSELQTILTVMRAEISRRKRALENVEASGFDFFKIPVNFHVSFMLVRKGKLIGLLSLLVK